MTEALARTAAATANATAGTKTKLVRLQLIMRSSWLLDSPGGRQALARRIPPLGWLKGNARARAAFTSYKCPASCAAGHSFPNFFWGYAGAG